MNIADFISRLDSGGFAPKKTITGFESRCPAHDDKTPSLSVTSGSNNTILVKCHTGCSFEQIIGALGIQATEMFEKELPATRPAAGKITETYNYCDRDGRLVFQVVRMEPKTFRQRHKDANGQWVWNMNGVQRVLYRLPEIVRDVSKNLPIIIVEGEKDANALAKLGFSATCNSGGAKKWLPEYSGALTGADVYIIADKDQPGREHAQLVAQSLFEKAKSIHVLELPDIGSDKVKDASDWLNAGGTKNQLSVIVSDAKPWTAAATPKPLILDAATFMAQPLAEPPQVVHGLLHQGSKLALGGGSKSFKTWTLLDMALSVAYGSPWLSFPTTAGKVLFVNFEIQDFSWQSRIKAVSDAKKIQQQPGNLHLLNLRGQAAHYKTLIPQITEMSKSLGFALIILDPVYKLYGGTDENSAGEVAGLLNAFESLAVDTGAAIAFGCHFSKGNQAGKESIDRISGSGVFARDPDSLLMMTKHESEGAFTVEATLRNFPQVEPFVVSWSYPMMRPDSSLDPQKLKQVAGRKQTSSPEDTLALLKGKPLSTAEWKELAAKLNPPTGRTKFYDHKEALLSAGKIIINQEQKWKITS